MSIPTETAESWLHQLLHQDWIPPEALAGGMTPETAWEHWADDRARAARGLPKADRHPSRAERWWYQRFDHTHLQERGADLSKAMSAADVQPLSERAWIRRPGDGRPYDAEPRQITAFQRALRPDGWLPVPGPGWTHPAIPGMVFSDPTGPGWARRPGNGPVQQRTHRRPGPVFRARRAIASAGRAACGARDAAVSGPEAARDTRAALGRRIAVLRRAAGLTQRELGVLAGYSRSAVARAEASGACSRPFASGPGGRWGWAASSPQPMTGPPR